MNDLAAIISRLQATTDALAAIGARLSVTDPDAIDPDVRAALDDVLAAAGVTDVDGLDPQQRSMMAGVVRTALAQAADLLNQPERPPGWAYTDPTLLDGQGRGSMLIPVLLAAAPELADVTSLLDVGTGVGLLAVAATRVWPNCTVVGIDTWGPSLEAAYENVKAAGLDDRIEIRRQDLRDLDDAERYDCVWVPSFFFIEAVLAAAMPRILAATRPGGHVVVAHYEPPPDPLPQATMRLRTVRDGGAVIDAAGAARLLADGGCEDVHPIAKTRPVPVGFAIGRKAAAR